MYQLEIPPIFIYIINMIEWIDRDTAIARLGVKAQTLYSYASRGRIRMQPDPTDSRRSLYNANDIAVASIPKARGRKPSAVAATSMNWGEPAIPTRVSTVHRGQLSYRGQDAIALACNWSLEETAALLWDMEHQPVFSGVAIEAGQNIFSFLAANTLHGQPILGRSDDDIAQEAGIFIGKLASVCGASAGAGPIHERLARGWCCDLDVASRFRKALVAMADHDLNASTFTTRIAASTGASLSACLLAGLCTLSGPRHGGADEALRNFVADAQRHGAKKSVRKWLERDRMLPGFGHDLYPNGDPRAALILAGIKPADDFQALADSVFEVAGLLPNCDFALAVMVDALGLPQDAPFKIFLIGRAVGWCAHIIEQNRDGSLIRPQGRYLGKLPA